MSNCAKAHPLLTGIHVVDLGLSAISFLVIPVLGAIGFTVAGPVAGSAAAAWQASIGAVQAGSPFAWCHSTAMSGAAVGGVQMADVAGATLMQAASVPGLVEMFENNFRTADRAERS